MKRRILAAFTAACLLMLLLCGCSGAKMKSPMGLMRPPLTSSVNSDLKSAFLSAVTGKGKASSSASVTLIPPLSGDYRSAFVLHDIDNDGEDEALVFYKLENEPSKGHMNVLDFVDDAWTSIADFSGSGTGVNFVRFVQMTSEGCPVILVSQSLYESDSSKILSAYVCTAGNDGMNVKNVCTEVYSVMENIDVDSDGHLDVFIIQQDFTNINAPRSTARAFRMTDAGAMEELASAKLDGGISQYCSVQTEKVTPTSPLRIYVDAIKGENQAITEVIYWDWVRKAFVTPMFSVDTQSNMSSRRDELLASQDYDGDGVIEIPSQHLLPASRRYTSPKNLYEQMNITGWIEIQSDSDYEITDTLVNSQDSYIIDIAQLRMVMSEFTVYAYDSTKTWVFKEYSSKYESVGEDLFAIVSTTKENADSLGIKQEDYLIEDDGNVVYFEARDKGTLSGITSQSIKPCIKIFKVKELIGK